MLTVLGYNLLVEKERVGNLNRIIAVCAYKQLCIVEGVKVVDRCRSTELYALDLLQVDEERLLFLRIGAAVLYPV